LLLLTTLLSLKTHDHQYLYYSLDYSYYSVGEPFCFPSLAADTSCERRAGKRTVGGSWRVWTGLGRRRFRARTGGSPGARGRRTSAGRRLARAHRIGVVSSGSLPHLVISYCTATFRSCRPRARRAVKRRCGQQHSRRLINWGSGLPLRVTH
jgi:hypothetical protein